MVRLVFIVLMLMLVHWLVVGISPEFGFGFVVGMVFMLIMYWLAERRRPPYYSKRDVSNDW